MTTQTLQAPSRLSQTPLHCAAGVRDRKMETRYILGMRAVSLDSGRLSLSLPPPQTKDTPCVTMLPFAMYLSLGLVLGLSTHFTALLAAPTSPSVSPALQSVLNNAYQAPLYTYSTSLTQGIVPVYPLPSFPPNSKPLTSSIERNPLPQRLLAPRPPLYRAFRRLHEHRSRCLAGQWHPLRRA